MQTMPLSILPWMLLGAAITTAPPVAGEEVLTIRNKRLDSETKQLHYELSNDSERTVTAWRLSLARSDPHGHAQNSILDQDFFEQDPVESARAGAGPLLPGASIEARWQLDLEGEEEGITATSVIVVAAVFDDLSWHGDAAAARAILQARSARVEEIGKIVVGLRNDSRAARSRQVLASALAARAEKLRQADQDPESGVQRRPEVEAQLSATRVELADWLEQASRGLLLAPNPNESLRQMRRDLERRYEIGLKSIPTTGGER